MDNNFNSAVAIANLHEIFNFLGKEISKETVYDLKQIKFKLIELYSILGIFTENSRIFIGRIKEKYLKRNNITRKEIEDLIVERNNYKNNKKYSEADEIRKELESKGIVLKDRGNITNWDIKIN